MKNKLLIYLIGILFISFVFADTTTYEINETNNNKAWYIRSLANIGEDTPLDPGHIGYSSASYDGGEYTSGQYSNIEADDGSKNAWNAGDDEADNWVNLWYNFSINEAVVDIDSIYVLWNGYDELTEGDDFEFDIWNFTSSSWLVINTTASGGSSDVNYGTTFASGFSDFVSGGNLHLGISGEYTEGSGGCAFVYSYDGEQYHPELALTDMQSVDSGWMMTSYGALTKLKPINNTIELAIWERVPENSYIDTLNLIEIEPINNRIILPEQYTGELHTINLDRKIYPNNFINKYGDDYIEQVINADDKYWVTNLSRIDLENVSMWDEAYFTFNPSLLERIINSFTNQNPKLVIRAKETGLFGRIVQIMETAMFGPNVKSLVMSDEELAQFLDWGEDAAMSIYYENETGDWEYLGRWFFGNVEFYHTYVMELNISVKKEMNFKIVGMPYGFQIDEIYMELTKDKEIITKELKPIVIENNMNISNNILTQSLLSADYDFAYTIKGDAFKVNYDTGCEDCSYVLESFGTAELWTLSKGEINESLVNDFYENRGERQVVNYIKDYQLETALKSETKVPHNTLYEDYLKVVITYSSDTCTCPGGTTAHEFDCSDECDIAACTAGDITFTGAGFVRCDGTWTIDSLGDPGNGCILWMDSNGMIDID